MLVSRGLSPPPGPGWSWQQCWLGHTQVTLGASMLHARHGYSAKQRQEVSAGTHFASLQSSSCSHLGHWRDMGRTAPTSPTPPLCCLQRVSVSHPFKKWEAAWDSPQETATHMPLASAQHLHHRGPRPHLIFAPPGGQCLHELRTSRATFFSSLNTFYRQRCPKGEKSTSHRHHSDPQLSRWHRLCSLSCPAQKHFRQFPCTP